MYYTTKRDILENDDGIYIPKTIENIEQDGSISFRDILTEVGILDAIPCLCVLSYKHTCLFQADLAELVVHLTEGDTSRLAIQAIRDWHADKITDEQLKKVSKHLYTDSCTIISDSCAAVERDYWDKIEKLFIEHFCRE